MKFVIDEKEEEVVSLTLESSNKGMIYLKANGAVLMGFKNGKYRKYSDASNIPGLVTEGTGFIVCDDSIRNHD